MAPLRVELILASLFLTAAAVLALPETCCHTLSGPALCPALSANQNKSKRKPPKDHVLTTAVIECLL